MEIPLLAPFPSSAGHFFQTYSQSNTALVQPAIRPRMKMCENQDRFFIQQHSNDNQSLLGFSANESNDLFMNDPCTQKVIGCAIEVHRELGPGLLECAH